jgi:diaminopimelate epimerase
MIPFVKMHGCGNDFIVVQAAELRVPAGGDAPGAWLLDPATLAQRVCDRHFGVGADGLLLYTPLAAGPDGTPRLRMLYWNADGSRAEMCGNGARCVVRLAFERGETASPLELETDAGTHAVRVVQTDGAVSGVEIDMGAPDWQPAAIPVQSPEPVVAGSWRVGAATFDVSAVSMGNPHAIVFLPDREALERLDLDTHGRALATDPRFPAGANASFVAPDGADLALRVWERGVGPTLACGTATCAAYAVASRLGRLGAGRVRIHVPGGEVEVWQAADGHLWLAGPAVTIATGRLSYELFADV